jgi:hypothetical protein
LVGVYEAGAAGVCRGRVVVKRFVPDLSGVAQGASPHQSLFGRLVASLAAACCAVNCRLQMQSPWMAGNRCWLRPKPSRGQAAAAAASGPHSRQQQQRSSARSSLRNHVRNAWNAVDSILASKLSTAAHGLRESHEGHRRSTKALSTSCTCTRHTATPQHSKHAVSQLPFDRRGKSLRCWPKDRT